MHSFGALSAYLSNTLCQRNKMRFLISESILFSTFYYLDSSFTSPPPGSTVRNRRSLIVQARTKFQNYLDTALRRVSEQRYFDKRLFSISLRRTGNCANRVSDRFAASTSQTSGSYGRGAATARQAYDKIQARPAKSETRPHITGCTFPHVRSRLLPPRSNPEHL